MLPGTFIVDQQGIIQYAYYSEHAGDHPEVGELLAVSY
jgi:peroxiredoxin